jgi:alkylhydroperoxidase/carboxymuconolactone decarboxylase family protein
MSQQYYDRSHLGKFSTVARGSADLAAKFFGYYGSVFQAGALSQRMKSLTALSVAHVVQCPYCIDAYTGDSLEKGADLEQMTEAVHVGAAVRGGAVVGIGAQMSALASAATGQPGATRSDAYYTRAHVPEREAVASGAPGLYAGFTAWEQAVFADGELSAKEKAVIAVAIAHTVQSPYQIDRCTQLALSHGATMEQLIEAVHVAVAIRGGASLVHAVQMLEQIDQRSMA